MPMLSRGLRSFQSDELDPKPQLHGTPMIFRRAEPADLPALVALGVDDELGSRREDPSFPPNHRYAAAFEAIDNDPNQLLALAEDAGAIVVPPTLHRPLAGEHGAAHADAGPVARALFGPARAIRAAAGPEPAPAPEPPSAGFAAAATGRGRSGVPIALSSRS